VLILILLLVLCLRFFPLGLPFSLSPGTIAETTCSSFKLGVVVGEGVVDLICTNVVVPDGAEVTILSLDELCKFNITVSPGSTDSVIVVGVDGVPGPVDPGESIIFFDACPEDAGGAEVNELGCTGSQSTEAAVEDYKEVSVDLLQSGSEIGSGEVLDVLFLIINAREGIVEDNFLFRTKPADTVVGDRSASADIDEAKGETLVKAASGSASSEAIIASTAQVDIINTIIGFGLPGLSDPVFVEELLEIRQTVVLEGSQVFEFKHTAFEKLEGFKNKKIDRLWRLVRLSVLNVIWV